MEKNMSTTTNQYYGINFERNDELESPALNPIEGLDKLSCIFHGTTNISKLRTLNSFVYRPVGDLEILEGLSTTGISHLLENGPSQPNIGVNFLGSTRVSNAKTSPVDIRLGFDLNPTQTKHFFTWQKQSDGVFKTDIGNIKGKLKFGWENEGCTAELTYKWHNAPEQTRYFRQTGEVIALTRQH